MPIPFAGVAVRVAVKLGLRVAERKKWLPNQAYSHLAMEKLKENNLSEASRLNEIALHKNPVSEKAQIMQDLISMRIDARIAKLVKDLDQASQQLMSAQGNLLLYRKKRRVLLSSKKLHTVYAVLPLILLILLAIAYIFYHEKTSLWIFITGFIVLLLFILFQFIRFRDSSIERELRLQELHAGIEATIREIAILDQNINQITEKIKNERAHKSC